MASIGKIGEFDASQEEWSTYVERLELFCMANEINDERKKACLLTQMGPKAYRLLQNLVLPAKPNDKKYDEIVKILEDHLMPKRLVISERFRFYNRNQQPQESMNDYVAELRRLTKHCKFGGNLDEMLRDRFVCGLHSESIQEDLLTKEDTMKFMDAVSIAVSKETAMKDALELRKKVTSEELPVQEIATRRQSRKKSIRKPCEHCGRRNHEAEDCFFKHATCKTCNQKGHITKVCSLRNKNKNASKVHDMQHETEDEEEDFETVQHFGIHKIGSDAIWLNVNVNGRDIKMELDTGSAVTVMSKQDFLKHFPDHKLNDTRVRLKTYTGEKIKPMGILPVNVRHNSQQKQLELLVVEDGGAPLFGRDWLKALKLDWRQIFQVSAMSSEVSPPQVKIDQILKRYEGVFQSGIGTLKGIKAKLRIDANATPKFCRPRQVPYALRPKVEAEIEKLESEGILSKVSYAEWATPVVPVPKPSGSVRICGDFKITINSALQTEEYPLPLIADIFASLAGGQNFTVIDLAQAYHQMEIDEDSKKYLILNTQKGLYQYNRLVFGIKSAPAIWQRAMDQVLQGIKGAHCYLDDILITGKTTEEHLQNLEEVLKRLNQYGLRANKEKCKWFHKSVSYLGHVVSNAGLKKSPDKIKAVTEAPKPQNVSSLRSFLGLINYYNRFIPNLASVLQPLYQLLEKGKKWNWSKQCEEAFQKCKLLLTSDTVLTHYDPDRPVRLACDASQYGIGAVLSHILLDKSERPIAYASRSLSVAEKNYAQIDKEALGLIWGVKRFNQYLYGRHFQLITDHKPLTYIFHPEKGIPATAAARMQRWALYLSGYNYDIIYKNTKQHGNADGLSRLPVNTSQNSEEEDPCHVFSIEQIEMLPVTMKEIEHETRKDPVLSRVYELTKHGWPKQSPDVLKEFHIRSHELSIQGFCIMWGIRVIIPKKYQQKILEELHLGHIGIVKMKSLARSYVWWPGIDKDIEEVARACSGCQDVQKAPVSAPLHPWEWPATVWERLHVDFAGPYMSFMFLVVVDAHSKWPEIYKMKTTTASDTVSVLRTLFARTGLPLQLVSDNGPQFVADEFTKFMKENGIQHIRSAPYHPATNGLAERMVQTFKLSLKASKPNALTLQKRLDQFLMAYRNAKHATTNRSPAELFYGRNLRMRLDLIKPDARRKVLSSQAQASKYHGGKIREFEVGDSVLVRDYRGGQKWMRGQVVSRNGMHYDVQVGPDTCWRRHIEQIVKRTDTTDDSHLPDSDIFQKLPTEVPTPHPAELLVQPDENISSGEQMSPDGVADDSVPLPPNLDHATTAAPQPDTDMSTVTSPVIDKENVISERRYPLRNRKPRQLFQI